MSDVILRFEASDMKFEFCGVEGAESSVLAFVAVPDSLNVPISDMTSTKNWGEHSIAIRFSFAFNPTHQPCPAT